MKKIIPSTIALLGFLLSSDVVCGELFKDGETVCLLGDSITARGATQTIISDYYLTRFPDRHRPLRQRGSLRRHFRWIAWKVSGGRDWKEADVGVDYVRNERRQSGCLCCKS